MLHRISKNFKFISTPKGTNKIAGLEINLNRRFSAFVLEYHLDGEVATEKVGVHIQYSFGGYEGN